MVADYDYIGEWGFAAIIESDGNQILFDTGFRPNTVLENADSLNIDLSGIEHVFLSHNHMDHAGGLRQLRLKLMTKNKNAMKYKQQYVNASEKTSIGVQRLPVISNECSGRGPPITSCGN